MTSVEIQRRQQQLDELIDEMCRDYINEEQIPGAARELREIYRDGFHHSYWSLYNKVSWCVLELSLQDVQQYLTVNLESLQELLDNDEQTEEEDFASLREPFRKLSDHLNLELSRMNDFSHERLEEWLESMQNKLYFTAGQLVEVQSRQEELSALSSQMMEAQQSLNTANASLVAAQMRQADSLDQLEETKKTLEEATGRAASMQTEIVAVIGIFSAILITFTGSLSFLGQALVSMENTHIFKVAAVVIICGLVLGNSLFLFMYLVARIIGRNIYSPCKSDGECHCGREAVHKDPETEQKPEKTGKKDANKKLPRLCGPFRRVRRRLPFVFYYNVMLFVFFVLDCVLWRLFQMSL